MLSKLQISFRTVRISIIIISCVESDPIMGFVIHLLVIRDGHKLDKGDSSQGVVHEVTQSSIT